MASINAAIGAESAFTLQCKSMVADYVPQIIEIINSMPLDQVRVLVVLLFNSLIGCIGVLVCMQQRVGERDKLCLC